MASDLSFVEYVVDQIGFVWNITYKKMFGEYWIYLDWKYIACVCDNQFLLKPTDEVKKILHEVIEVPPYPWAKNYFLIENLEDREYVASILKKTYQLLPEKKTKKK